MVHISIIVNFYNSGKYIPKLLKSVVNQSFADWQLICIDDCSPNNDNIIIEKWSKKLNIESKVVIIRNQENIGISRSKEVGINYVKAYGNPNDYTTFMDGDDWLEPDALENLYNATHNQTVDVVASNHYRVYKLGPFEKKELWRANLKPEGYGMVFTRQEAIQKFLYGLLMVFHYGNNIFPIPYWAKLYKNSFLSRLKFDFPSKENVTAEDNSFSTEVLLQCESLTFIDKPTYNWCWGGITSGNRKDSNWSQVKILAYILDSYPYRKSLIEKYGFKEGQRDLLLELKNVSWWTFRTISYGKPNSSKAQQTIHTIGELIDHPSFEDLKKCDPRTITSNPTQLKYLKALEENDVESICKLSFRHHKETIKPLRPQSIFRWFVNFCH